MRLEIRVPCTFLPQPPEIIKVVLNFLDLHQYAKNQLSWSIPSQKKNKPSLNRDFLFFSDFNQDLTKYFSKWDFEK